MDPLELTPDADDLHPAPERRAHGDDDPARSKRPRSFLARWRERVDAAHSENHLAAPFVAIAAALFGRRVAGSWTVSFDEHPSDEHVPSAGYGTAMVVGLFAAAICIPASVWLPPGARELVPSALVVAGVLLIPPGLRRLRRGDRRAVGVVLATFLLEVAFIGATGGMIAREDDAWWLALVPVAILVAGGLLAYRQVGGLGLSEGERTRRDALVVSVGIMVLAQVAAVPLVHAILGGETSRAATVERHRFGGSVDELIAWANDAEVSDAIRSPWRALAALPLVLDGAELARVDRDRIAGGWRSLGRARLEAADLAALRHGIPEADEIAAMFAIGSSGGRLEPVSRDGVRMRAWIQQARNVGAFDADFADEVRETLEASWPTAETPDPLRRAHVVLELADLAGLDELAARRLDDVPAILDRTWAGDGDAHNRDGFGRRVERQGYVPRDESRLRPDLLVGPRTSLTAALLMARLEERDPALVAGLRVDLGSFLRYLDEARSLRADEEVDEGHVQAALAALVVRRELPPPATEAPGRLEAHASSLPALGALVSVLLALGLIRLAPVGRPG